MSHDEPVTKGGYVYFMTNPSMPGHMKIGSTRLTPDERARQLSSGTAVARPFKVIAFQRFEDQMLLHAERELHAKYKSYRVPNREFFELELTAEQAQAGLKESHIAVERDDMDPRDAADWQRQHEWLAVVVSAFERWLAPRVAKLPPIAR